MDVLVRVLQKDRTSRMCIYTEREREINFKELAHVIVVVWLRVSCPCLLP